MSPWTLSLDNFSLFKASIFLNGMFIGGYEGGWGHKKGDDKKGKSGFFKVTLFPGINDFVFLLGGLGVISVAMLPYLSKSAKEKEGVLDIILSIIVITMFIAYFVSNHDLHYILEDYLGVSTKLAEAGIIALVIKQSRSHSKQNNLSSN